MKIQNEFTVDAPVQQAWEAMLDLERIAPCLPGASIDEAVDGEYQGTMAVKMGPISARYRGTVKIEETDEEGHRAVVRANGSETRGQGSASATITSTLFEEDGGTRVRVETDMQVSGRVAQFGRGIMQDVAEEMIGRFSECVEQEIIGGGETAQTADEDQTVEPEVSEREATTERNASTAAREGREENRGRPTRAAEPLDLGDVSRGALVKRAAPALAGLAGVGLLALVAGVSRRASFSVKLEIRKR